MKLAFPNLVGAHCSSSALRSVLAYDGIEMSEALTFGLGSGLGFFYLREPLESPTRRLNGRAPDLEGNFYRLVGQPVQWATSWQPELIKESLAANRPVLAQTDIHPIPYYDDAHFTGHGLVVVGLEGEEVLTADIAADGFSSMTLKHFRAAVAENRPPLLEPYHYAPAPKIQAVDVVKLAPLAIQKTVNYMLEPPSDHEGLAGLRRFAADLPNWTKLPDLAWAARYGYQGVEKRGTGGGGFRLLYRDFLREVSPVLELGKDLIMGFEHSGRLWTNLAQKLKVVSFAQIDEQAAHLTLASQVAEEIAGLERGLFTSLSRSLTL